MTIDIKTYTAAYGETTIEISVRTKDGKCYAACKYPAKQLNKEQGNPYGSTGAQTLPLQTPFHAKETAALDNILDMLEKKLGKRPVLNKA